MMKREKLLTTTEPIEFLGRRFIVRVTQSNKYGYYYCIEDDGAWRIGPHSYLKEAQAVAAAKAHIQKERHFGITH